MSGGGGASPSCGVTWIRAWEEGGVAAFRVGRDGDDLVAEWVGAGVLRASRTGSRSEFIAAPGMDADRVEKFHRGLVNALVRHLHGKVTLHASAVARGGVAVALAGPSGSGKSTTAASLCALADVEMLADDTVALEPSPGGLVVLPTEATSWLPEASARALGALPGGDFKAQLRAPRCATSPSSLAAIVQLAFDAGCGAPRLRPVEGLASFQLVAGSLFRFVVDDKAVAARDFEHVSAICRAVPTFELVRRPALEDLPACVQILRRLVDRGFVGDPEEGVRP